MKQPPREASHHSSVPSQRPLSLRLKSDFDPRAGRIINQVLNGLPALVGDPISLLTRPHLRAHRGLLLSGPTNRGNPVHAASFIRTRQIILETQLLRHPSKLRLIAAHEIFHFVWARLGNKRRASYNAVIAAELAAGAIGELGESADSWKQGDKKVYVCESFCDTAAWLYSGVETSPEFTLSPRWHRARETWFTATFAGSPAIRC